MIARWHFVGIFLLVLVFVLALGYPEPGESWFFGIFHADETARLLLTEVRFPRLLTAILAGAALSVCGLLLQTLFNNPLAGPSILGLTSGSHLFVALFIMATPNLSYFFQNIGISAAAGAGALVFSAIVVGISKVLKSSVTLLLTGMLLGTFVSALTSLIQSKADPNALKAFTIWAMGSLQQPDTKDLLFIAPATLILLMSSFLLIKPLNAMILGDIQAHSLGVNILKTRNLIIVCVAALTGLITAFCGPIAFIGLIVPNVVRIVYKTGNHFHLMLGSILTGAVFLLLCEWLIVVLEPYFIIHINILTSLLGAPVVIAFMIKGIRNA